MHQHHDIWPLIRLVTFVVVVAVPGYLLGCRIWSYAACRKCEGAARFKTSSGKAWRLCPRCDGSGRRTRLGRKIWNHFAKGRS
jgi:DnaJ-class molecular chaperone